MEIRFGRRDTHSEQQTKKKQEERVRKKIFFFSMRSNGRVQLDKERQNTLKKKKKLFGKHHQLHKQRRALEHKKNYSILCNL